MAGSPLPEKLREECGVFGIDLAVDAGQDAAYLTYNALFALQHRGQESAGIAIRRGGQFFLHKQPGLVPEVFSRASLGALAGGEAAIGHVRYAMDGSEQNLADIQPLLVRHASGSMALCFNGRLVNSAQLRLETETRGGIFQSSSDAEVISHIIVREHLRTNTTEDAVLSAMHDMIGAFSLVILDGKKLIAARDPNGFRPLCVGTISGHYAFASESCVFAALGGTFLRDVAPGEVLVAEGGALTSHRCGIRANGALCVFEFIYFARPDSVMDGLSVDLVRRAMGSSLAKESDTEADLVVGVPDSGLAAAMGFSAASGIPYGVGLIKNRYIARTFIQSEQNEREKAVRIKLGALAANVRGKRIILVDDSIVRGTTCARIVSILRAAGALEVHVKVSSPPFLHPCYFGTDIPRSDHLAAHNRTTDEVRALIGADSLQYLSLDALHGVTAGLTTGSCDACFTGRYAVPVPGGA